jgi:hypothetical protein
MTDDEKQQLLDDEHLRLLRLGYLISGVVTAPWALFPLIHVTIGIVMLLVGFTAAGKHADPGARIVGLIFVIIGTSLSAAFASLAILKLLAARRLRERRSKTFCLVVAAITCLGLPYGTALGVFTILVLRRPSVDASFRGEAAGRAD